MKIKFRALCLMMALAAFASAAFAADPTTFVYSNSDGQLGFLAVGESSVSVNDPITISQFAKDSAGTAIKVFTSSDKMAYAGANNMVYEIVASADGSPAVSGDKIPAGTGSVVVDMIISADAQTLGFVGNTKVSFDDDNVLEAGGLVKGVARLESGDATATFDLVALADQIKIVSKSVNVADADGLTVVAEGNATDKTFTGLVGMVTLKDNKSIYAADSAGLYKITGVKSADTQATGSDLEKTVAVEGAFKAMAFDATNNTIYLLRSDGALSSYGTTAASPTNPVSADLGKIDTTFTNTKVSLDMNIYGDLLTFIDDNGLYVYKLGTSSATLVGNAEGVVSIAKLATTAKFDGGDSDGDGDSESDANSGAAVDATSLTDTQKDNLKEATGGDAADFVAPDDVTVADGTAPDATVTANVITAAGTGFEGATVAAFKNYTLKNAGYLLIKLVQNAGNVKIFLVPVSTSSSNTAVVAADDVTAGVLLDSDYKEITSGSSTYGASTASLAAGTYTLVTATKSSSGDGDGDDSSKTTTSSSSGGCDAGFGLWAAAALMAVSTISKRR